MGRKFVLDVDEDRIAISIMHAYMLARGVDPNEVISTPQQGTSTIGAWLEMAQKLADTGSFEYRSACVAGESSGIATLSKVAATIVVESEAEREAKQQRRAQRYTDEELASKFKRCNETLLGEFSA